MPRRIRELKADLVRAGFINRGGRGSHTNWQHPKLPAIRVTISGGDGDDAQHYQERAVREALAALAEHGKER
jgi:predicted RNA binding protein YcfA (HicA-like mRNA interferase family)